MFISATSSSAMMLGSFATGFLGDRYGAASPISSILPGIRPGVAGGRLRAEHDHPVACRFVMGFWARGRERGRLFHLRNSCRQKTRGKWLGLMAVCVVTGPAGVRCSSRPWVFPSSAAGDVRPRRRRRAHRLVPAASRCGIAALAGSGRAAPKRPGAGCSRSRRKQPKGRPLPAPAAAATIPASPDLATLFTGRCVTHDRRLGLPESRSIRLLYGFVTWLPVFFIKQGLPFNLVRIFAESWRSVRRSASPSAPDRRPLGPQADHHRRIADLGRALASSTRMISDQCCCRRWFALTVPNLRAGGGCLFGIYIPELFPTEVRLRASGIVQHARPVAPPSWTPFLS